MFVFSLSLSHSQRVGHYLLSIISNEKQGHSFIHSYTVNVQENSFPLLEIFIILGLFGKLIHQ